MEFYVAAKFQNKREALLVKLELSKLGHKCTSRWLSQSGFSPGASQTEIHDAAVRDLEDIRKAGVFILLPQIVDGELNIAAPSDSGGRHVEMGYAIAHHKNIYVLGPRNNVFHYLYEIVSVVDDLETLVDAIKRTWP